MIKKSIWTAACLFFSINVFGFGVSPAVYCVSGVEVGEDKDTGIDYEINNDSEKPQEFVLEIISPLMPSDESLKGYSKLPDLSWIYLEKTALVVPGKSTGKSRIHIKVPKNDKYYNQHWAVSCHIKQKANSFAAAAVAPFLMIETKAKEILGEKPYGEFGVVPSIIGVELRNLKNKKMSFKIFNNTSKDCVYKIKSYIPDAESKNAKINTSESFEWINEAKWVKPEVDNLKIRGNDDKQIDIEINLPENLIIQEGEGTGKGFEALILIESDSKEKRFIRVLIIK